MDIIKDYKKYAGSTKTVINFTMFDKNYIMELGNRIKSIEDINIKLLKRVIKYG